MSNLIRCATGDIVGKTITGVVVKQGDGITPRVQFYLVFDDNTYFEFDCPDSCIYTSSDLRQGNLHDVRQSLRGKVIFEAYVGPDGEVLRYKS